jgi:D-sedoheptulose 7-phosphate isomerase
MEQSAAIALTTSRIREAAGIIDRLLHDREYLQAVAGAAAVMADVLESGKKILFFGNGGSAADAQHLAAELMGRFLRERKALPGWALTTNSSVLTAIGNDYSFDLIFARQLEGCSKPGDVAFGISTSGTSRNVLEAMKAARERQLVTIGLTGGTGGDLPGLVDHCIVIPADQTPRIQEAHILTGHILCELVEQELFPTSDSGA